MVARWWRPPNGGGESGLMDAVSWAWLEQEDCVLARVGRRVRTRLEQEDCVLARVGSRVTDPA